MLNTNNTNYCEHCKSIDNKKTFPNGSVFCFTPNCVFNKNKPKTNIEIPIKDKKQLYDLAKTYETYAQKLKRYGG